MDCCIASSSLVLRSSNSGEPSLSQVSILLTTTTCGFDAKLPVPYRWISRLTISKSPTGSSLVASTKCKMTRQRSTCRRKACPNPTPSAAPSIRPGTSQRTIPVLPAALSPLRKSLASFRSPLVLGIQTPRFGTTVVNGYCRNS